MNVPVDAIKRFNDESVINIISSTLNDQAGSIIYYPSFNPVDKIVELYERILKTEREKVELLEEVLKNKN